MLRDCCTIKISFHFSSCDFLSIHFPPSFYVLSFLLLSLDVDYAPVPATDDAVLYIDIVPH